MDVVVGAQATAATRGGTRSHLDALCIGLVFVAGVTLCMQVFSSNRLGARPQIEDEFVYLFQAKTLANGHLTYPSPPLPEFFEAAHLLVVPRFAAKYLPGHALVLLPFLAAGVAWLGPCLLLGATAALLFVAARLAGLSRAAGVGAALILLGAADVFPFFASYLSQSTSLATVCALIVAALAVERRPSAGRIAALAACRITRNHRKLGLRCGGGPLGACLGMPRPSGAGATCQPRLSRGIGGCSACSSSHKSRSLSCS